MTTPAGDSGPANCPTCNGREWINGRWVARRETVGMVCQTCGHDYAPAAKCTCDPGPEGQHRHWCDLMYGEDPEWSAPAEDGGLREALERLASKWEARHSTPAGFYPEASAHADGLDGGYEGAADDLRELLAAHPAAPAVPQPVDREALRAHLLKAEVVRADGGYWDTPTPQEAERIADAVLAVLAGEQEQQT